MEVLNEGCFLGLLVPAATVSCSSSAYWLCNCYYFFLSLTLFFYSPLCDFSVLSNSSETAANGNSASARVCTKQVTKRRVSRKPQEKERITS